MPFFNGYIATTILKRVVILFLENIVFICPWQEVDRNTRENKACMVSVDPCVAHLPWFKWLTFLAWKLLWTNGADHVNLWKHHHHPHWLGISVVLFKILQGCGAKMQSPCLSYLVQSFCCTFTTTTDLCSFSSFFAEVKWMHLGLGVFVPIIRQPT